MLIAVEGLDGAGTTTLVEHLDRNVQREVTTTAEPTDSKHGALLQRRLRDDDSDELANLYLFLADRITHIGRTIEPAIRDGNPVICDRYADSTRAYQTTALAQSEHFDSRERALSFINASMDSWVLEPDVTVYLDVSVDTAMRRSSGQDTYEERQFLESVKKNYEWILSKKSRPTITIDGEQPEDAVRMQAMSHLQPHI